MRTPVLLGLPALLLALGAACGELPDRTGTNPWREAEEAAWADFLHATIRVSGTVVDPDGAPVAGATVEVDGVTATTDGSGVFSLVHARRNAVLRVDAPGFRRWVSAVQLVRPLAEDEVRVPPMPLTRDERGVVRFLFGGDVAMGRRYLDPDEDTPRDEMPPEDPTALIRRSTAAEDSIAVVDGMVPFFEAADYRVINLETPVTDDPSTPHTNKIFAFFTLPESLEALHHLGVQMVSLGNNHVYDYLEQGVVDTLRNVTASGIGHAGAGSDLDQAWEPYRTEIGGVPWSFLSATSIAGIGRGLPIFVAEDDKGGAADLRDGDRLVRELGEEQALGRDVIVLMHTGNEYARAVSTYALGRMALAAEHGAPLIVGHHTHTAQGFTRIGDALAIHSLGNFAFDQDRLETMVSYTVDVDVRGTHAEAAALQPHVLEEYVVRPAVGDAAERQVRLAGEVSTPPIRVVPWAGRGILVEDDRDRAAVERELDVPLEIGEDGVGYLDLRPLRRVGESVTGVASPNLDVERVWLGEDLLNFGDFEDVDVDADVLEETTWYWSEAAAPCVGTVFRGAGAMCLWRLGADRQTASVAFRHRIRLMGDAENTPNRDVTFFGRIKADDAGEIEVYARFYASMGDKEFGSQSLLDLDGGTFDWRPFVVPVHVPDERPDALDPWMDNPRAIRVFLAQHPPEEGAGQVAFDDLAVVTWYLGPMAAGNLPVPRPHIGDFVRVQGTPGTGTVHLTFERDELAVAR